MSIKSGVTILIIFVVVWFGGGIALFGTDPLGVSSPQIQDISTPRASTVTTYTQPPISTPTLEVQLYKEKIQQNASLISSSFLSLADLLESPDIYTESWIYFVAGELATIRWAYEDLANINPPSFMVVAHNKYVQGVYHINKATYLLSEGIDTLNPDLIEQAITELDIGGALVIDALNLMDF